MTGGLLDFFVLEATEYVDTLDGLASKATTMAPEPVAFARAARGLRGAATMAKLGRIADVAQGLERLARQMREGHLRWDAAIKGTAIAAIDDLKILVRGARIGHVGNLRRRLLGHHVIDDESNQQRRQGAGHDPRGPLRARGADLGAHRVSAAMAEASLGAQWSAAADAAPRLEAGTAGTAELPGGGRAAGGTGSGREWRGHVGGKRTPRRHRSVGRGTGGATSAGTVTVYPCPAGVGPPISPSLAGYDPICRLPSPGRPPTATGRAWKDSPPT